MTRTRAVAHGPLATSRGFTLLELVIIVAMLGILAAAVAPSVVSQIVDRRVDTTQAEVRALYEAMVGNPQEMRFGFVGDIGRLPTSLTELGQPQGLPSYTTSTARSVGMGWRGPYVNTGTSPADYLADAFGRGYGLAAGQVRSAGPDGVMNTSDDIAYPPSPPIVTGGLTVTVKTMQGQRVVVDPAGYRVDVFYPSHGVEDSVSNAVAPFTFSNLPMGFRAVRVVKTSNPNAGAIVGQDTVVVHPGSTAVVEIWF